MATDHFSLADLNLWVSLRGPVDDKMITLPTSIKTWFDECSKQRGPVEIRKSIQNFMKENQN